MVRLSCLKARLVFRFQTYVTQSYSTPRPVKKMKFEDEDEDENDLPNSHHHLNRSENKAWN